MSRWILVDRYDFVDARGPGTLKLFEDKSDGNWAVMLEDKEGATFSEFGVQCFYARDYFEMMRKERIS